MISSSRIAVRRGDDADVDLLGLAVADAEDDALLQRAQELHLEVQRQLADLVEEERALVGAWNLPGAARDRAGEGALHVAEELALDEVLGDGAAVDGDERARSRGCERRWSSRAMSSLPVPVSPVMSTLMSVVGDLLQLAEHLHHRRADADDLAEALVVELGRELLLVGAEGAEEHRVLQDERGLAGEDA